MKLKTKCWSKRNDLASSIRNAIFSSFEEDRLERVDNNTPTKCLAQWKTSTATRDAYAELFENHDLLQSIGHLVFKSFRGKELPTMHCAFVCSICDILLNPACSGIKCNDRSVTCRVEAFMVNYQLKSCREYDHSTSNIFFIFRKHSNQGRQYLCRI